MLGEFVKMLPGERQVMTIKVDRVNYEKFKELFGNKKFSDFVNYALSELLQEQDLNNEAERFRLKS